MSRLGIAMLCALGAGVIVCLLVWPWGPPPVSEGNGPAFVFVPQEIVAIVLGGLTTVVAGVASLIVAGICYALRPVLRVPPELEDPAPLPVARVVR